MAVNHPKRFDSWW